MSDMKRCRKCGEYLPLQDFNRRGGGRTDFQSTCRTCSLAVMREWRANNPDRIREIGRQSDRRRSMTRPRHSKEKLIEYGRRSYWKHVEKNRARASLYQRMNRGAVNAVVAGRRKSARQATPSWSIDFFVKEAYELAALRTDTFGFQWHVDHIVPLKSKLVCGLHSHTNIRVIPAALNKSKSNRYWPDMPTQEGAGDVA